MVQVCGYQGPIYMTHPTKAIMPIMLEDYHKVRVCVGGGGDGGLDVGLGDRCGCGCRVAVALYCSQKSSPIIFIGCLRTFYKYGLYYDVAFSRDVCNHSYKKVICLHLHPCTYMRSSQGGKKMFHVCTRECECVRVRMRMYVCRYTGRVLCARQMFVNFQQVGAPLTGHGRPAGGPTVVQ